MYGDGIVSEMRIFIIDIKHLPHYSQLIAVLVLIHDIAITANAFPLSGETRFIMRVLENSVLQ